MVGTAVQYAVKLKAVRCVYHLLRDESVLTRSTVVDCCKIQRNINATRITLVSLVPSGGAVARARARKSPPPTMSGAPRRRGVCGRRAA